MTPTQQPSVTQADRQNLSHHEQMLDAQSQCVPCKLCGGDAVITDAGLGAGYYIACKNGKAFNSSKGCLITERRLGGWAYNVMEWWNRLHREAVTAELSAEMESAITEEASRSRIADSMREDGTSVMVLTAHPEGGYSAGFFTDSDPTNPFNLRAENERLRVALTPFAEMGETVDDAYPDCEHMPMPEFTAGQYRRAVAALSAQPSEQEQQS